MRARRTVLLWGVAVCIGAGLMASRGAHAQSSPNFVTGQVPTAAQWNSYFAGKVDTSALSQAAVAAAWAGSGFGFTTAPTPAQVAAALSSGGGLGPLATQAGASPNAAVVAALGFTPYNATNPSGFATLFSPNFTGDPQVPTAAPGTSTLQAASTYFVTNAVTAATAGVASFNTRTGAVTLTSGDVTTALTFVPYNATNPSNYITASGAPVQSVASQTGAVTVAELYAALEGTTSGTLYPGNNPSGYVTATSAPVTSVATLTGAVTEANLQAQLVGTTGTKLTAGNDSRITGACQTTGCTMAGAFTPSTTSGIVGTAAADNANAGSVGEYLSATGTSTAMTATTYTTLTSLTLTAGDWDVSGTVQLICSSTTTGLAIGGVSTTSAAAPVFPNFWQLNINNQGDAQFAIPVTRFDVSSSTPVYAIGYQTCASGTITGQAFLRARRVR